MPSHQATARAKSESSALPLPGDSATPISGSIPDESLPATPFGAGARPIYLNGQYLASNPEWHVPESAWKASHVLRMLRKHHISPKTVGDVGCGAGEVLKQLQPSLDAECSLWGYDVSHQAIGLANLRANERLQFCVFDVRNMEKACFDLLLVLDVIEHLEDYYGFLGQLKHKSQYKIFHIPLDLSVQTLARKNGLLKRRNLHAHLHYFSKETALETLRDAGYETLDHFYTARSNDLGTAPMQQVLKVPRKLLFAIRQDWAVRVLGGYSLLVLAR